MTSRSGPAEFRSRSREAIESFLHTVVVLDDLAEMPRTEGEPAADPTPGGITSPGYPASTEPTDDIPRRDPRRVPLKAELVIDGFAEIGSVCAVLKANPDDGFQERTVKAARRADIVILDWTIHGETGAEALRVLREIVRDDRDSRRLRLIAIYTGEPRLGAIYEQVRDAVLEFYQDEELKENEDLLRMSRGPLHVVLLAKAGVFAANQSEFREHSVAEGELADRLANDFAEMTGGLIRNAAIAGIAGIRANAHRILAKFEPSLDPAYLGHRLLLHHPPDAADHIEEALSSEIASVLEGHRPGKWADGDAIESWLAHRDSEVRLSQPLGFPGEDSAVSGWRSLLDRGFEAPGMPEPGFASKGKLRRQATEPFAEDAEAARRSNLHFAALLTLKTRYPGRPPRLLIGSVLHSYEGEEDRYFLCLQPKCDSVRLRHSSGFPFIPLVPLTEAGDVRDGMSLRLVVERETDQWEHFSIAGKPSELTVRFFEPGDDPPGEVEAKEESNGRFFFEDTEGRRYRWIAQVKDDHALGVAGEVAAALARPGPSDPEWLRRSFGQPRGRAPSGD